MFSRPFWGNISCLSAKLGLVELPSTPRQANLHRSLALDHDKKMVLTRDTVDWTHVRKCAL